MVKFKDFPRPLSVVQLLFKASLIVKDFSRKPSKLSTVQACANPVELLHTVVSGKCTSVSASNSVVSVYFYELP